MGAWRWILVPFAEPRAVLPEPGPCCADTGANDNAVVRIRASPTLGRFSENRPVQMPHLSHRASLGQRDAPATCLL